MKRILSAIVALILSLPAMTVMSQDEAPKTPFAYPVAPDTCSTLESRCNYICQHFWDNYDISKPIASDEDFLRAFRDYIEFFQYAHRNVVLSSIADLMNKARSNTPNLLKVGKAAELSLFFPTAVYYSDEVYVEFAKALASNNSLKKEVRTYYADQLSRINSCQEQKPLADIDLVMPDGSKQKLSAMSDTTTTVMFFYADGVDSSIGRTRLSADANLESLIDEGLVRVISVYLGKYQPGFADAMPAKWVNVCSEQALETYDFRALPCCYIVDSNQVLLTKNLSVDELKEGLTN